MNQKTDLMRIAAEKSKEANRALAERRAALLNVKLADISDVFLKNNRLCDKITELSDADFKNILSAVIRSAEFNNLFDDKSEEVFNRKKMKADKRKASREAHKAAQHDEEVQNCAGYNEEICAEYSSADNKSEVGTYDTHFAETYDKTDAVSYSVAQRTAYTGEETSTVSEQSAYADNTEAVSQAGTVNLSGTDTLQGMTAPPSCYVNGSNI